jgi:hypothetical protein
MTAASSPPVTYGPEPQVAGKQCDGLICEQFIADGVLVSTANVVYLKVEGSWHRLAIDHPTIHWRPQLAVPQPWSVAEKGWEYPHVDVAATSQLIGLTLLAIERTSDRSSTRVAIIFEGRRRIEIWGTNESVGCAVI